MMFSYIVILCIISPTGTKRVCPDYIQNVFQNKMVPAHIEYNDQGYLIWKAFNDNLVLTSMATPPEFKHRTNRRHPTQIAVIHSYTIVYSQCQLVIFIDINDTAIYNLNVLSRKYGRTHYFQSLKDQDELLSTALFSANNRREFTQPKCTNWSDNNDQNTLIWILTIIAVAVYFIITIFIAAAYKYIKKCCQDFIWP